ncbi:beta-ketoacyl-ACP synthase II [Candidatus Margulisiibacteriota bacterium]
MHRVVVTGLGVVSSIGIGHQDFFNNLTAGKSGIRKVTRFDASDYTCQIAGEVNDFDSSKYLDKKEARRLVRFIKYAIAAAQLAVKDANFTINHENANQVGVYIGSGIGGIKFLEDQVRILMERGPAKLSPFTVPLMICDMAAGYTSINLGAKGPNSCIVTACASGTHNIGEAYRTIQSGRARAMICGGSEAAITPMGLGSFCAAKALTADFNDSPEKGSRPFEAKRSGFVMGEGAGIVLLETLEDAIARGAEIYAEVVGYGMSGDAHHITAPAPEGEGACRAIEAAFADAGLAYDELDYINAHGTSTILNDKYETVAIKRIFGEKAKSIPISSNKSMIGHLLGAAGGVEAAAMALTIKNGIIPPTINYDEKDPDCDLDYVPNVARKKEVSLAMSNSFGFGGHNAILLFKKYKP